MQCPNCGKEALNVNGRYVCLDCGIEITPNGAPAEYQKPAQTVVNHDSQTEDNAAPAAQDTPVLWSADEPQTPNPVLSNPEPATQNVTVPSSSGSVRDYYMESLTKMVGEEGRSNAAVDGAQPNQPQAIVPDFPVPDETGPTLASEPSTEPQIETAPPIAAPAEAPVPEIALAPDFPAETPEVTPDLPAPTTEADQSLAVQAPIEVPTPDNNVAQITEPENYFQPETFDIKPEGQPQTTALPASESVGLPQPASTEAINPFTTVEPIASNPPAAETLPGASQPEPRLAAEPAEVDSELHGEAKPAAENSTSLPGISGIPSAESVFGPDVNNKVENDQNFVMKKNPLKKILLIAAISIGAAALIGGLIYGIIYFVKPRNAGTGNINPGKVLNISATVGDKMDNILFLSNKFEQTIDFSGLTVKAVTGEEQKQAERTSFFAKPTDMKGNWQLDVEGDSSFTGTFLGKEDKRIYIKSEGKTYVFSPETNTWIDVAGFQLNMIPPLYPLGSKGSLFYALRTANIVDQGSETIERTSYRKYQIVPQAGVVEELLISTNPLLLSGLNLTTIDLSKFTLTAYVDNDSRIYKVVADGEIAIDSNYASGVVAITSQGVYNYSETKVTKP